MKIKFKQKISKLGIGPIFAFLSIGYSIVIFFLSFYFYPIFQIKVVSYPVLIIIGISFILIGILFLIISVITFTRAYKSDTLAKSGIFRCCRHPLYASWTIFIVPGITLLINSWLGLTIPIFMYFLLRILIKKEEKYLEDKFGSEYLEYKKKTPFIIPYGCLKRKKKIV